MALIDISTSQSELFNVSFLLLMLNCTFISLLTPQAVIKMLMRRGSNGKLFLSGNGISAMEQVRSSVPTYAADHLASRVATAAPPEQSSLWNLHFPDGPRDEPGKRPDNSTSGEGWGGHSSLLRSIGHAVNPAGPQDFIREFSLRGRQHVIGRSRIRLSPG